MKYISTVQNKHKKQQPGSSLVVPERAPKRSSGLIHSRFDLDKYKAYS